MQGGISQRQLAKRFCVSLSFVEKLLKQYKETQSIAPKLRTKQTSTKLNLEQLNILQEIVEAKNDATLSEIRLIIEEKTGIIIGISTVDRMLRKMKIPRKNMTLFGESN